MVFNKFVYLILLLHANYWLFIEWSVTGFMVTSVFFYSRCFSFPVMGLGVNMINRWMYSQSDRERKKKCLKRWIDEITDSTEYYNTNGNSNLWIGCKEIELEVNFWFRDTHTSDCLWSHQYIIGTMRHLTNILNYTKHDNTTLFFFVLKHFLKIFKI